VKTEPAERPAKISVEYVSVALEAVKPLMIATMAVAMPTVNMTQYMTKSVK